jgi:urea transport system substrate-binding protein
MARPRAFSRRRAAIACGIAIALVASGWWWLRPAPEPIRVGILHSLTGPMAISERSMVDAEQLAIEEINASGGLLGRPVQPIVADGKSDWPTFAAEAERLITTEQVVTVFGCWTSACRKTVRPVFERLSHLLVYPMAYEGLEQSPYIVYTGAAPNQQVLPALKWGLDRFGRRVFLVGSDYVWPHAINAIMKDQIRALGAELVGEEYVFFGSTKVDRVVERIRAARPDVIFSAVVGDTNAPFYQALRAAGITAADTPVISFSTGELEMRTLPLADLAGHYAAWNYFQSIPGATNAAFVERYRRRYGADAVISDVMAAAYFSVHLWAQAVEAAGSDDVARIRAAMLMQSVEAPEGVVSIDPATRHTWRPVSIGQMTATGSIDVVWSAARPIRPVPYPATRTRAEWDRFLNEMYVNWGGSWANPVER